jgi:hypothetical protein
MPQVRPKTLAIAGLILAVAAAGGYWAYTLHNHSQLRKRAAALVTDTGLRLRAGLAGATAAAPAAGAEKTGEIEGRAAAVDRNYSELRRMDADALGELAGLADDYILTSREVLRRIAITHRAQLGLAASSAALHDHMRSDRGHATWPAAAVRLKDRVDQDYRNYRLAAEALLPLLDSLPASQARIDSHLGQEASVEAALVAAVRAATLERSTRLADEVGKLTDLDAYR